LAEVNTKFLWPYRLPVPGEENGVSTTCPSVAGEAGADAGRFTGAASTVDSADDDGGVHSSADVRIKNTLSRNSVKTSSSSTAVPSSSRHREQTGSSIFNFDLATRSTQQLRAAT